VSQAYRKVRPVPALSMAVAARCMTGEWVTVAAITTKAVAHWARGPKPRHARYCHVGRGAMESTGKHEGDDDATDGNGVKVEQHHRERRNPGSPGAVQGKESPSKYRSQRDQGADYLTTLGLLSRAGFIVGQEGK